MIRVLNLRPYTGDLVAPSPNRGARRAPVIRGIVLHATEDAGNEAGTLTWLRSPKSRASCHLLVGRSGRVIRLVGDQQRAWHAGRAQWRGTHDVNSVTLGIEIANRNDGEPFTDAQYARVAAIVAHYCRQGLALDDVVGHGDVATGRRTDPLGWDWARFRAKVRRLLRAAADSRRATPRTRTPERDAKPWHRASLESSAPSHGKAHAGPREKRHETPPAKRHDEGRVPSRAPSRTSLLPASHPTPRTASLVAATNASSATKPVLRSRTLWLNGLTVLVSGSMLAAETLDPAHDIAAALPADLTKWVLFGVGVASIVLRLRTTQPLACGQRVGASAGDCGCEEEQRVVPRA